MNISVRLKITVLIAVLFAALAAVLVATSYSFAASRTTPQAESEAREDVFRTAMEEAGIALPVFQGPGELHDPSNAALHGPSVNGGMAVLGHNDSVSIALRDIEQAARQGFLDDLLSQSLIVFLIVAVVAIPMAWWLAGRILRPFDEVIHEANSLSVTNLSRRLSITGPDDEFRRLKTAFNGMLERLDSAFEARQRFASDASHELRTPLAVMRAKADNVLDGDAHGQAKELAAEVREQVHRSESLVDSLLTLARADDVQHIRKRVDLADIVASVASGMADTAMQAGIAVELDLRDAPVLGDAVPLERMVANALDNAIKYNLPFRGSIACTTRVEGDDAVMVVSNPGLKIRSKDIPRLFERFERGETPAESDGHGLGLPIIRRVAEVHGGSVKASTRRGGGLSLEVRIPLAKG